MSIIKLSLKSPLFSKNLNPESNLLGWNFNKITGWKLKSTVCSKSIMLNYSVQSANMTYACGT